MNNKANDIMNSIMSINESCVNAQWAVTNQLVGLSEKYSEMYNLSKDPLIFQESKVSDFMEYDPNEKVIKTILLAIPRLIMHLIQFIRTKWNDYKIRRKCQMIEDKIKKDIDLRNEANRVRDELDKVYDDQPDGFIVKDDGVYYMLKIVNIDNIEKYYDDMVEVFKRYANAVENMDEGAIYGFASADTDTRELLKNDVASSESKYREYSRDRNKDEVLKITNFVSNHKSYIDEIDKSMEKLDKWVSLNLNSKHEKSHGFTKDSAKKMLDDARKLHDIFLKADNAVLIAINESVDRIVGAENWLAINLRLATQLEDEREKKKEEADKYHEDLFKQHPEAMYSDLYNPDKSDKGNDK